MEIRYLEQEEKERSRKLWGICFPEDSARFLDYYYEEKCRDNQILVLEDGNETDQAGRIPAEKGSAAGEIGAMLQRNPYWIYYGGEEYGLDYIVGVATAPERRHQGFMRRLLMRMLEDQNREQMPFTFLMPADPAIYRPFGFVYVYDQPFWKLNEAGRGLRREAIGGDPASQESDEPEREMLKEAGRWLNQWLAERYQVFARRDYAYMLRLWKEIISEYGRWELLYDGDRLVGMECFWGKEKKERRFLYAEEQFTEQEREARPAIMARIVNLSEFLKGVRLAGRPGGAGQNGGAGQAYAAEEETAAEGGGQECGSNPENRSNLEKSSNPENRSNLEKSSNPENRSNQGNSSTPEYESKAICVTLGIQDRQMEANHGLFSWEITEKGSRLQKLGDEIPDGVWTITIEALTQWLMGYRKPEDIPDALNEVQTTRGIFLDEVV